MPSILHIADSHLTPRDATRSNGPLAPGVQNRAPPLSSASRVIELSVHYPLVATALAPNAECDQKVRKYCDAQTLSFL
jgi:hypothetical protein